MISLRAWFMVLVLYLIAICTLLSRSATNSDFLFLSNVDKRDLDGTGHRMDHLGLTGGKLIRLFEKHLVHVASKDRGDVPIKVSRYYDAFKDYLFDEPSKCNPIRSVVARLTRDVEPVPIHSHNDYWRSLPLFEALAYGATSVEADVWIVKDPQDSQKNALAVAHNENYIDSVHQSLDNLYTDLLLQMLNEVNCQDEDRSHGVFFDSPETTLFLFIDFKSQDNRETYSLLMNRYLKPLIDQNYTSYYDMNQHKMVWRQITVVLTGDFPNDLDVVDEDLDHGYFHDDKRYVTLESSIIDQSTMIPNTSVMAASSFSEMLEGCHSSLANAVWRGRLDHQEITCMKSMISKTQQNGVRTRIWGVPNWPRRTVKTFWRQIVDDLQSDVLNVDKLRLATRRF